MVVCRQYKEIATSGYVVIMYLQEPDLSALSLRAGLACRDETTLGLVHACYSCTCLAPFDTSVSTWL